MKRRLCRLLGAGIVGIAAGMGMNSCQQISTHEAQVEAASDAFWQSKDPTTQDKSWELKEAALRQLTAAENAFLISVSAGLLGVGLTIVPRRARLEGP